MKSERATVEEPSHSGGKSIQNILDNKSIRRTTTMTVGLLSTIWMIDMIDRVMIGLALPMIGDEFSLSNTQLGGVVSIFAIFYMLGQVPGGMLADRFGPRPLLIVALILWSVFTALTGFAWGLVSLMVMRAMFGLSQGLFPAASFKALAERTRPKTRATAMGFMIGANNLGPGIAPLIIAPVLMAVGWRDAFCLVAIVGAVIGTVVWLVLPAPLDTEITEDPEAALQPLAREHSRAAVFKSVSVWKFALLFCLANMAGYGLLTWVPSYLLNEKGLSLIDTGIFAAIPFIVTALAIVVGGRLVDKYFHDSARILLVPCMATSAILLFLMTTTDTVAMFTFYQTLAMGVSGLCSMSIFALPLRALPAEFLGSGMGLINGCGQLAGFITPLVMGWMVDQFSYMAAFGVLVGATAAAALVAMIVPQTPAKF